MWIFVFFIIHYVSRERCRGSIDPPRCRAMHAMQTAVSNMKKEALCRGKTFQYVLSRFILVANSVERGFIMILLNLV